MHLNTSLTLGLLFILTSCSGGGGGNGDRPYAAGEKLTAESPYVVGDTKFSEGMGLLLIKKHGSLGVCTSFMISPTELMTNSHCIKNISLVEDCGENVVVHVKSSQGYEFKRCQRIIKRSVTGGSFNKPDFAVIELDSPFFGKTKSLSRAGVAEGVELTVESVDYSGTTESLYGNRKISKCTPMMNAAMGNYTHGKSSIIPVFGDRGSRCKIIQGNSGSPIYDSSNNVVSIMFATLDRDELRRRVGADIRNTALATNLACIRSGIAWFDQLRSSECNTLEREEFSYMSRLESQFRVEASDKRRQRAENLKQDLAQTFEFDLKEKLLSKKEELEKYSYTFDPKCIKDPSTWTESEMLKVLTTSEGKRRYATAVGNYGMELNLTFDEYLRPQVMLDLVQSSHYELIVEDIDSSSPVKIKIARVGKQGKVTITEHQVPVCQNI